MSNDPEMTGFQAYRTRVFEDYWLFEKTYPATAAMLRQGRVDNSDPGAQGLIFYHAVNGHVLSPAIFACVHAASDSAAYNYGKKFLIKTADDFYQRSPLHAEVFIQTVIDILGADHVVAAVLAMELQASKEFLEMQDEFHLAILRKSQQSPDPKKELLIDKIVKAIEEERRIAARQLAAAEPVPDRH